MQFSLGPSQMLLLQPQFRMSLFCGYFVIFILVVETGHICSVNEPRLLGLGEGGAGGAGA